MSRMTTRQPLRTAALAAALALVAADFAAAQRGGGGRGGRGFGPPPVYENEGFQEEVGLTAEQVERLNELREKTRAEVDFGSIRERMQNASEEERGKIREEIGKSSASPRRSSRSSPARSSPRTSGSGTTRSACGPAAPAGWPTTTAWRRTSACRTSSGRR